MSTHESAGPNPQTVAGRVTVEVVAWVTRFVGGDGTRRRLFDETAPPGATVRSVLSALSDRYPDLRDALWDHTAGELSEHIEVLVNDAVLGLTHTLDSPIRHGDRITLIGQYTGGSGPGSRGSPVSRRGRPAVEELTDAGTGHSAARRSGFRLASAVMRCRTDPRKLPRDFYLRADVLAVARDLLGEVLVVPAQDGTRVSGIIVETEAYRGPEDRASHAYGGRRTRRTETMYGNGGTAYVYFVYGMYHQFNVVTNAPGVPHAVLVRAVEPLEGIERMRARRPGRAEAALANGPGKLCVALGIDRSLDAADLLGARVWIEEGWREMSRASIASGPRIGIEYAGAWAEKPWRFWLRGSPFVSRSRVGVCGPKR